MNDYIKQIAKSKWERKFNFDWQNTKEFFTIKTDKFIIALTGGSAIIRDKKTGETIQQIKGYNYLYTGDVKPDESELFALENGKHFYVISLKDFTQKLRITLPRSYEAMDVYGSFSEDGKSLCVPVCKYGTKRYLYYLCEYETENYTLVNMTETKNQVMGWH